LARDRNPAKGKPLLRQGTDGNRSRAGDISLNPDYALQMPNIFAGFISCLEPVAFFRVSKLTHRRPERQCNLARDRNPAKGKPLLRQGARMATVHGKGIFL